MALLQSSPSMIRRGKAEGWLQLPPEALLPWAMLNNVDFNRTVPGLVAGRGGALLAKDDLDGHEDDQSVLLTVPRDLVLSVGRVAEHAKIDRDFREVLEGLDDFGRSPRGAILSFLLMQASIASPDLPHRVGVHCAFSDYIQSLPLENLPTFWTPSELQLLTGTTLAPAISAKLKSLRREYDALCASAQHTRWYQAVQDDLDFDDWLQVDAMYRSRALDFPGIGHCMVPCVDLANHAGGDATVALYEKESDGNAVLLLRGGKRVPEGGEVTITYGDEKGACEMLFSYGFLDDSMDSARTLLLNLSIPEYDTSRTAKASIADCAPGFTIIESGESEVTWEGDFVWLLCMTEEDDLRFELARTVDGHDEEMHAIFQGQELVDGAAGLRRMLAKTDLWDVYQLRAVTILQQRVYDQLQILFSTQEEVNAVGHGSGLDVRTDVYESAVKLRQLEFELLEKAYEWFENEKLELVESPVVARYLASMNQEAKEAASAEDDADDFS